MTYDDTIDEGDEGTQRVSQQSNHLMFISTHPQLLKILHF